MSKKNLALFFGGPSAEHDVSLVSAKCILKALDRNKFNVLLLGLSREGVWYLLQESDLLKTEFDKPIDVSKVGQEVMAYREKDQVQLVDHQSKKMISPLDVAFPIIHGTIGEDGSIQGYFKVLGLPFVGCDVAASSACMDKEFTKRILENAGIKVAPFLVCKEEEKLELTWQKIQETFKMPIYVKPANMGSSVGVHKANSREEFLRAAFDAFNYDSKILIEENIEGEEVEVAVLGNMKPEASLPGAFRANDNFYTYEAKYLNKEGATFHVPATSDPALTEEIRQLALKVYDTLDCRGMARVDLFLTPKKELIVNEVNTLPGFTPISMYPQLWEKSGVPYSDLLNRLIDFAFEEHERRKIKAVRR